MNYIQTGFGQNDKGRLSATIIANPADPTTQDANRIMSLLKQMPVKLPGRAELET